MDLAEAFEAAGFATTPCATAEAARAAIQRAACALIILDVLLPDASGIELLAEVKSAPATASIPVVLLSTEAEVRDRVLGLRTGADEYVGKPYDAAYVVSRARELMRRSPGRARAAAPTVLVIDDSATLRGELTAALESAGYGVVTAASGEQGLRVAAAARPAAVIVDGNLPGIDGPTVVRRLRMDLALRRTPLLLLTSSEETGDELRAFEAGADAFVRKDQDTTVILTRLAAILRAADAPSAVGPKRILAVDDSVTYLH